MKAKRDYRRSTRKNLDMEQLGDIKLPLRMVLGVKPLSIRQILELRRGSVVEINRLAGENIDLYINNRPMAKGEVVVMNDNFAFRVVTIMDPEERLKHSK